VWPSGDVEKVMSRVFLDLTMNNVEINSTSTRLVKVVCNGR
jgi:hypothetical protein